MVAVVVETVDPERLALSWAFTNKDLTPLIASDVFPGDFEDAQHRKIFEWALEHYRKYATSPGLDALRLFDPNWGLGKPTDNIDVYIADIKDRIQYNKLRAVLQIAKDLVAENTVEGDEAALATIVRGAAELSAIAVTAHDEDITLNTKVRADFYDDLRTNPGALRGMSTGFQTIDRATGGVQSEQFIVIGGFKKSGKSTALMKIGQCINLQGKKALMVSFEMSGSEQKGRWDAMWAQVNYRKLLDGRSTRHDMAKIRKAHRRMEDGYPFILTTDIGRMTTVSGISAKMEKHSPDIVLIDGIYLMMDDYDEPPGSPQALTNITRDIKRLAQQSRVPIIGTTQASETKTTRARGITSTSFSWSQSFGQDADVLIGLQPADEEDDRSAEIRVLESRHGPRVRAELIWDWDTMTFEERYGGDDDESSTSEKAETTGGY